MLITPCLNEQHCMRTLRTPLLVLMVACMGLYSTMAWARSSETSAAFTATQLVRQFTLKNTVSQVNQGLQGFVSDNNGTLRGLPMAAPASNFPADMGTVPVGYGVPTRDGAGRPLGYCAWDNGTSSAGGGFNAGLGASVPLVYAVVSAGMNGAIETSCAQILATRTAAGDDYVEFKQPQQTASQQYRSSVATYADLAGTPGAEGDVRLVRDTNRLYAYQSGSWTPVSSASNTFSDDSASNGAGAISYTAGKVTMAEFQATVATLSSNLSVGGTGTFNGALTAKNGLTVTTGGATVTGNVSVNGNITSTGTFTATSIAGSGSGLTDLNASNISSGLLTPAFGGTGVNASTAGNGQLLIGNGSGFALGNLTGTANQVLVSNGPGSIVLSLPQNIATTSTPTFGGLTLNGAVNGTTGTFSGNLSASRLILSDSTGVSTPNLVIGAGAMTATQSGSGGNTAVGISAMANNTSAQANTAVGKSALAANTSYSDNTALGAYALTTNSGGNQLTAIGSGAMMFSVNAYESVAVGYRTLFASNGPYNVAVGNSGLGALSNSSSYNTAVGHYAMSTMTSGSFNVGVGGQTGNAMTSGNRNTFLGQLAGGTLTTGNNNTFLGRKADVTGGTSLSYATVLGSDALVSTSNTIVLGRTTDTTVIGATGTASSGILQNKILQVTGDVGISGNLTIGGTFTASGFSGNGSGLTNLNANNISAGTLGVARGGTGVDASAAANGQLLIGNGSGFTLANITGTANQVNVTNGAGTITLSLPQSIATTSTPTFGGMTLNGAMTGTTGTFAGNLSAQRLILGDSTGGVTNPNLVIGSGAMAATPSGAGGNTAVGLNALASNTSGTANVAMGFESGNANTTGSWNVNLGYQAGRNSTTASNNIAIGYRALLGNTTGWGNVAIGNSALLNNTFGQRSVAIGEYALQNATVGALTAIGWSSLGANTTGGENSAFGYQAAASNTTGAYNDAFGYQALLSNTTGSFNTAFGNNALANSNGNGNVSLGSYAMFSSTSGNYNVALGLAALQGVTTGSNNVALGKDAGYRNSANDFSNANTTGSNNTFLGAYAMPGTTTQLNYATVVGSEANVSTSNTVVLGRTTDTTVIGATGTASSGILQNKILQVTGDAGISGNLVIGGTFTATGFSGNGSGLTNLNASNISSGTLGVARGGTGVDGSAAANGQLLIGNGSGYTLANITGTANQVNVTNGAGSITLSLPQDIATTSTPTFGGLTLNGAMTGTTGNFSGAVTALRLNVADSTGGLTQPNVAVGTGALTGANSGNGGNTAVGYYVLTNNTTGAYNTAVGAFSLFNNSTGTYNAALGGGALQANTTGSNNTAIGMSSLTSNTTGADNTAVGLNALRNNTTASGNTAVGSSSLNQNTTGTNNTALGRYALLSNTTAGSNTAIGESALYLNTTGDSNTALGRETLLNNDSGGQNVAVGRRSLMTSTSASRNTLVGNYSGMLITTGGENAGLGYDALRLATTGVQNTALGAYALNNLTTGGQNLAVGKAAGSAVTTGNYNSLLGTGADVLSGNLSYATALGAGAQVGTSNTIVIGRTTDSTVIGATGTASSGILQNKILQVTGDVGVSGNVTIGGTFTANAFSGDGSGLTNLNANNISSGTLSAARGGTGVNASSAGNGKLLIGNGSGFSLNNLTAGNGINISNGSGTITITNSGVRSFNGRTGVVSLIRDDVDTAVYVAGNNTALGASALSSSSSGFYNVAVGLWSAKSLTSGGSNVAVGVGAMEFGDGSDNVVIGREAMRDAYGSGNTAIGKWTLLTNRNGSNNTALGSNADTTVDGLSYATTIGADSVVSTSNTIVLGRTTDTTVIGATGTNGSGALLQVTGKASVTRLLLSDPNNVVNPNLVVGTSTTLSAAQSGNGGNTVFGNAAMTTNTSGADNSAFGFRALSSSTTGVNNAAFGANALRSTTTGGYNVGVGSAALNGNTTGSFNTAVGIDALNSNGAGTESVAVGMRSLYSSSGANNVAIGNFALANNTTGQSNVALGRFAGYADDCGCAGNANITGSNNTFLGAYAMPGTSTQLSFATALGSKATVTTSNTVALGRSSDVVVIAKTGDDGSGNKLQVSGSVKATAFNTSSDRRLKTDIAQLGDDLLGKLTQLNAYQYRFIADPTQKMRYGVIAQEIAQLFPNAVSYDALGFMTVDYGALGAIAAAGVGKLNNQVVGLNKTVKEQGERIVQIDQRVVALDGRVGLLETWKTEATGRMDSMQKAIDVNIEKIAQNALKISSNTDRIVVLEDAMGRIDKRMLAAEGRLDKIEGQWNTQFSVSEDGQTLTVKTPNLVVSNFTAEQVRAKAAYTERLEAEMARIRMLEVDNLKAGTALARNVQAETVNTGSTQVYAGAGLPAFLFAAQADGHYTVNTSAMDGSYATATVIVNAGQAKVVTIKSEGIELIAEGNTVKAIAAGKTIRASWIKMG
ncbi:MAG TPA: tail fiber domain-containing protein [Limnobacter sp.]|uniref:tail fiber domain-containing protein n=1 Tax=Limnobacter sp. TaxID=2003368 RepID=UPI002EDA6163